MTFEPGELVRMTCKPDELVRKTYKSGDKVKKTCYPGELVRMTCKPGELVLERLTWWNVTATWRSRLMEGSTSREGHKACVQDQTQHIHVLDRRRPLCSPEEHCSGAKEEGFYRNCRGEQEPFRLQQASHKCHENLFLAVSKSEYFAFCFNCWDTMTFMYLCHNTHNEISKICPKSPD